MRCDRAVAAILLSALVLVWFSVLFGKPAVSGQGDGMLLSATKILGSTACVQGFCRTVSPRDDNKCRQLATCLPVFRATTLVSSQNWLVPPRLVSAADFRFAHRLIGIVVAQI